MCEADVCRWINGRVVSLRVGNPWSQYYLTAVSATGGRPRPFVAWPARLFSSWNVKTSLVHTPRITCQRTNQLFWSIEKSSCLINPGPSRPREPAFSIYFLYQFVDLLSSRHINSGPGKRPLYLFTSIRDLGGAVDFARRVTLIIFFGIWDPGSQYPFSIESMCTNVRLTAFVALFSNDETRVLQRTLTAALYICIVSCLYLG